MSSSLRTLIGILLFLDHTLDDDEHWYNAMCNLDAPSYDHPFDSEGNYREHVVA
jgi:hypothetical protein